MYNGNAELVEDRVSCYSLGTRGGAVSYVTASWAGRDINELEDERAT